MNGFCSRQPLESQWLNVDRVGIFSCPRFPPLQTDSTQVLVSIQFVGKPLAGIAHNRTPTNEQQSDAPVHLTAFKKTRKSPCYLGGPLV